VIHATLDVFQLGFEWLAVGGYRPMFCGQPLRRCTLIIPLLAPFRSSISAAAFKKGRTASQTVFPGRGLAGGVNP
jgi:hypothetical protein